MIVEKQIDLAQLAREIRQTTADAFEPVEWIDTSLPYMIDIQGYHTIPETGRGVSWNLQVVVPHSPNGHPDTVLPGKVQFCGTVTPGAWAALERVRQFIDQS